MKVHQGDVILEPIACIPSTAKWIRKGVVAKGEATGHAHVIKNAEIYEKNDIMYVRVTEAQPMTHEEHPDTKTLPKKDYRVRIQKEYFPDGSRRVKD